MGSKRLSDIVNLEVINIYNGEKYGYIGDGDLLFNIRTGEIVGLVAFASKGSFFSFGNNETVEIPWNTKIKQSDRTVIFDCKL